MEIYHQVTTKSLPLKFYIKIEFEFKDHHQKLPNNIIKYFTIKDFHRSFVDEIKTKTNLLST